MLTYVNLTYVKVTYVNLTYVNVSYVKVAYVNLTYVKVTYVNLIYVNVTYVNTSWGKFTRAVMVDFLKMIVFFRSFNVFIFSYILVLIHVTCEINSLSACLHVFYLFPKHARCHKVARFPARIFT
jgi:hypothetical protein